MKYIFILKQFLHCFKFVMTSTVFTFSCFLQISLNPMYLQKLYDSIIVFFPLQDNSVQHSVKCVHFLDSFCF